MQGITASMALRWRTGPIVCTTAFVRWPLRPPSRNRNARPAERSPLETCGYKAGAPNLHLRLGIGLEYQKEERGGTRPAREVRHVRQRGGWYRQRRRQGCEGRAVAACWPPA